MILLKASGIWILLAVLAIINGAIRTFLILPAMGEQAAHVAGTITFLVIQFIVIYLFIKKNPVRNKQELIFIGLFWLLLTIAFEFVFGHYAMNHPWEKLFADYNLLKGRLWTLVLINNIAAPLICSSLIINRHPEQN